MAQRPALVPGIIGALLLLIGIAELDYGFYTFLRIAVTAAAVVMIVVASKSSAQWTIVPLVGIAILWNPLIQIHLTREAWLPLDVIGAVAFIICGSLITRTAAQPASTPH